MRYLLAIALLLALPPQPVAYDQYFTADTMRVDFFHTGGPSSGETFALDQVVNDGAWAGSRTQLTDGSNLGQYQFDVRISGEVRYSRVRTVAFDTRRGGTFACCSLRRLMVAPGNCTTFVIAFMAWAVFGRTGGIASGGL